MIIIIVIIIIIIVNAFLLTAVALIRAGFLKAFLPSVSGFLMCYTLTFPSGADDVFAGLKEIMCSGNKVLLFAAIAFSACCAAVALKTSCKRSCQD